MAIWQVHAGRLFVTSKQSINAVIKNTTRWEDGRGMGSRVQPVLGWVHRLIDSPFVSSLPDHVDYVQRPHRDSHSSP